LKKGVVFLSKEAILSLKTCGERCIT
jgi:hypothetical protein